MSEPTSEPRLDAIVTLLERIAVALERLANAPPTAPSKPGEFIKWAMANGLPEDTRVLKLMNWANIRCLDEITVEALTGRPNAGKGTIEKIMQWKAKVSK